MTKITTYEDAATLLRSKGYSIKRWIEKEEITSLSVDDFSLSTNENMEQIKEILGEGWAVNKLSNHGLITIDKI